MQQESASERESRKQVEASLMGKEQRLRRWHEAKERHERAMRALEELKQSEDAADEDIKKAEEETNNAWLEAMMAVDPDLTD